jgi:Ca-activated chloride channel family protein
MNAISAIAWTALTLTLAFKTAWATPADRIRGGELRLLDDRGFGEALPLKHTEMRAEISGKVARVEVTQVFQNPYERKIEAVYVFPLPHRAAIDRMEIRLGERTIKGFVKKRDEARQIYERARAAGQVAALLDQERPNLFTQSVANILPGTEVQVKIGYVEVVSYQAEAYQFTFPMVVGPRFIPADVPDASRISPPVLEPGRRSGHDISLRVSLDAGARLREVLSPSHQIHSERQGYGRQTIELDPADSIPNKDFVLRYRIDGDTPKLALLPHREGEDDGYFLLLVQPETRAADTEITPKEMIFVVDCSGSMSGFPIEKVKEAMRHALGNLNPRDTFQIIRFSNRAEKFAPEPVPAAAENVRRGLDYVAGLSGSGGTIMLEGVRAALSGAEDPERLRIISFMTDGYIGNEGQILSYLEKNLGGARLFSFGVGSSVNRYLLDKMAEFGRGAVEYVLLKEGAEAPVKRFYERIRSPYLTHVEIDWGGLAVSEVYPRRVPDLFLGQPLVLYGRYSKPARGEIGLRARLGGRPYEQKMEVHLPWRHSEGKAIGTLWARARIEEISNQQIADPKPEQVEEITRLALAHQLVSAYTSFVAVEEKIVTGSGEPVRVEVPVPIPEGVSYEGIFGKGELQAAGSSARSGRPGLAAPPGSSPPASNAEAIADRSFLRSHRSPRPERILDAPSLPRRGALRIEAARSSFTAGEKIEIEVILENTTGRPLEVPARLSVEDGTARFQVTDLAWNTLSPRTAVPSPTARVQLAPGESRRFRVVLNGPGGYRFERPGTYHVVLLGASLGLADSNALRLRVEL